MDFSDISPYSYDEFHNRIRRLVDEPGFAAAVRYVLPDVDMETLKQQMLACKDVHEFQRRIVGGFLANLAERTTSGLTISGADNVDAKGHYLYISNHRDIVLDASFLNLCFIRENLPVTQIAIGNNLLIFDWIRDLLRINRSFIVRRDAKKLEALTVAKHLSAYIHHTITETGESAWIAQREGRAKDSNDVTQDSLLKMLTLAGPKNPAESLTELNIVPLSISYEYDPNDYLKVKEFLMKRRDPEFKKSQHDDLFSMETGIMQFKGHVHFTVNRPINELINLTDVEPNDRNTVVKATREVIDKEIHAGYKIYPINYIAYERLLHSSEFNDKYTPEQKQEVNDYIETQLSKVDVGEMTEEEHRFTEEMFLRMYANPLINKLKAQNQLIIND